MPSLFTPAAPPVAAESLHGSENALIHQLASRVFGVFELDAWRFSNGSPREPAGLDASVGRR